MIKNNHFEIFKNSDMKATNRTKIDRSEVMTLAHKLLAHWGRGLFAWSWSKCLQEAWRQIKIICAQRFTELRRQEVASKATTWIPTESEQQALYNWYHN